MVEEEPKVVIPGNTGRMDSRRLSIRLNLPHEVRNSCGGGGGSENMTSKELLPEECSLCGKRFGSAKALDGHMRIHSQGHWDHGVRSFRSAELSSSSLDDEKPLECGVCRKKFPSRKSLYGHMRLHPYQGGRGIQPPAKELELVPIIGSPRAIAGLSVTGKHGRRSPKSITSGLNSASMMACSSTQGTSEEVKQGDTTGNFPGTAAETEIPPEKKPPDDPRVKAEEASGSNPCTGMEDKKLKRGMKRKARELDGTDHDRRAKKVAGKTNGHTSAKCFPCNRCYKSFPTFQALGGHRSSCNETKQTMVGQAANMPGMCPWHPRLDLNLSLSLSLYTPGSSTSGGAGCNCTMDFQLKANVPPSREDSEENEGKMIRFL